MAAKFVFIDLIHYFMEHRKTSALDKLTKEFDVLCGTQTKTASDDKDGIVQPLMTEDPDIDNMLASGMYVCMHVCVCVCGGGSFPRGVRLCPLCLSPVSSEAWMRVFP